MAAVLIRSVRHQEQRGIFHEPDCLPANFAVLNSILLKESVRISKNANRGFETYSMLAPIQGRFAGVPLKAKDQLLCYYKYVIR